MKDYYKTLGVDKGASKDDIKKAFRKLAHEHHPDKNKNDPASAQKFKEASEAYSVLSDDSKRANYDQFGSAGPNMGGGAGSQGFGGFDFSGFSQGQNGGFHFSQGGVEFDLGDIFGDLFGGGRRRGPRKGANISIDVQISFKESIFGTEKDISVDLSAQAGKEHLSVKIPAGIESGQGLRIPDKGENGEGGRGDLIVRIWVAEHSTFRKEGFNLVMELPLKLTQALVGDTITLETLEDPIELKIPAATSHGEILRVKGKGVPYEARGLTGAHTKRGDLLIVTRVEMPRKLSKKAKQAIQELKDEGL